MSWCHFRSEALASRRQPRKGGRVRERPEERVRRLGVKEDIVTLKYRDHLFLRHCIDFFIIINNQLANFHGLRSFDFAFIFSPAIYKLFKFRLFSIVESFSPELLKKKNQNYIFQLYSGVYICGVREQETDRERDKKKVVSRKF